MKRFVRTVIALSLLGFAVWFLGFMQASFWIGGYQVTVRFTRPADGTSVRALRYVTCPRREKAERILSLLPKADRAAEWDEVLTLADEPKAELSVTRNVYIRSCGSTSMIGIDLDTTRENILVVIADLDDNRQVGTIVELPEAKQIGEVVVVLP